MLPPRLASGLAAGMVLLLPVIADDGPPSPDAAPADEERIAAIDAGLGEWQTLHAEDGPGGIRLRLARGQNRESVYHFESGSDDHAWTVEDYLDFRGRPLFVRAVLGRVGGGGADGAAPSAVEWRLFFDGGRMTRIERRFSPNAAEDTAGSGVTTYTQEDFAAEPNHWPLIHEIPLRIRLLAEQRNDYHLRTLTDMLVALPDPGPGPVPPAAASGAVESIPAAPPEDSAAEAEMRP